MEHFDEMRCLLGGMLVLLRREAKERGRAQVALELGEELQDLLRQMESERAGRTMAQGSVRFWSIWALWMLLTAASFVATLVAGLKGYESLAIAGVLATTVFCALQAHHCQYLKGKTT